VVLPQPRCSLLCANMGWSFRLFLLATSGSTRVPSSQDHLRVCAVSLSNEQTAVCCKQSSLRDLLNMGQIDRPARGFYTLAPANPTFPSNTSAATTPTTPSEDERRAQAFLSDMKALAQSTEAPTILNTPAARTFTTEPARSLNTIAATTPAQRDWIEAYREGENPFLPALSQA